MKKITFYSILLLLAIVSCSKDEPEVIEEPKNPMIGTKWEAPDEIATLIWGSTISRLEFLDDKNFQDISITKGVVRGTEDGTYTHKDGKVVLTYPKYFSDGRDRVLNCEVKGSLLITDQGQPSGGNMTYQKK